MSYGCSNASIGAAGAYKIQTRQLELIKPKTRQLNVSYCIGLESNFSLI